MKPMIILLAEDDVDVQYFIWKLLKADGHTVLATSDGKAALDVSRNHPGPIDLVISDVEMPRMGGLELCRNVAAERPGIKTLIMSGDLQCGELVSSSGFPFIHKPFTRSDLRDSIATVMGPVAPPQ
jgi:CheY-like chemotaxis protein